MQNAAKQQTIVAN